MPRMHGESVHAPNASIAPRVDADVNLSAGTAPKARHEVRIMEPAAAGRQGSTLGGL
jgi:hypothetical protein